MNLKIIIVPLTASGLQFMVTAGRRGDEPTFYKILYVCYKTGSNLD